MRNTLREQFHSPNRNGHSCRIFPALFITWFDLNNEERNVATYV
jgi:hypothetical protein